MIAQIGLANLGNFTLARGAHEAQKQSSVRSKGVEILCGLLLS